MYFYAVEATLSNPFDDPVGPAKSGWAATPNMALCEIETAPTRSMVLLASDVGYRTRATDPGGVVAYPPSVVEAFKVDVEANLDPTKSAVAAAFGNLTLNNLDGSLDSIVSNWNSDGQPIRVLRGQKTLDAARGILLDPPYASLVQVFGGVMGPWFVTPTAVQTALRDASYYLERQVPRNLYDGTGGLDGEVGLAGRAKPLAYGGPTNSVIKNVTPVLVDASNLIYQVNDGPVLSIGPIYDGGYAGITASGDVADLYSGTTAAGHYRTCVAKGLFQLGSSPTFEATADLVASAATLSRTDQLARYLLATVMSVPLSSISSADGIALNSLGPDPAVVGRAMALGSALYVATDDAVDGVTLLSRVLEPSGALLVPGSDGLLRIYVPVRHSHHRNAADYPRRHQDHHDRRAEPAEHSRSCAVAYPRRVGPQLDRADQRACRRNPALAGDLAQCAISLCLRWRFCCRPVAGRAAVRSAALWAEQRRDGSGNEWRGRDCGRT